jgi:hypothetical protein
MRENILHQIFWGASGLYSWLEIAQKAKFQFTSYCKRYQKRDYQCTRDFYRRDISMQDVYISISALFYVYRMNVQLARLPHLLDLENV